MASLAAGRARRKRLPQRGPITGRVRNREVDASALSEPSNRTAFGEKECSLQETQAVQTSTALWFRAARGGFARAIPVHPNSACSRHSRERGSYPGNVER